MDNEKYNGWTNRETWACNLWLTNDESIYNETLRVLREADKLDRKNGTKTIEKQDALKEFVEDLQSQEEFGKPESELTAMFKDIGSLWRVNWAEIVESFKEDLRDN